jgi:cytochrome c oxidase subunit 4
MAGHSYAEEKKLNITVLGALLVLTVITVAAAGVHFGSSSINTVVALLIASAKASLVALFFMHLKYEKPVNAVIFVIGLLTLSLFLIFTLIDIESRHNLRPANLVPPPGGPTALLEGEAPATATAAAGEAGSDETAAGEQ